MEHTPAYALKLISCHCNHEYGAREVEDMKIMQVLELCARQGKTGAEFLGPISDNAVRYLESIGYRVYWHENNTEFYVSFENASIPADAGFLVKQQDSDTSVWAELKQIVFGKSKIG